MTSPRFCILLLMAAPLFGLVSCGKFEKMDSRNPTVSQQDAYDVSWGLPPRKSRGNPKHYYQYRKDDYAAPPASAAPAAPSAPVPAPAAAPAAPPQINPAIPATLR
jgi:hypothetical protein